MKEITVNQFRSHLKENVEQVTRNHEALKVTRQAGDAFIVMSEEDWQRDQETLFVLSNSSLMKQIGESMKTHGSNLGYRPIQEEMDEINHL